MSEENNFSPIESEELSKEDILKAKREARRRKILENATNRLEKLNGRLNNYTLQNGDLRKKNETVNYGNKSAPKVELESHNIGNSLFNCNSKDTNDFSSFSNVNNNQEILRLFDQISKQSLERLELKVDITHENASSTPHNSDYNISDLNRHISELNQHQHEQDQESLEQQQEENLIQKIINNRLHLILIAFITYILHYTDNVASIKLNVFIPLLALELIELYFLKNLNNPSSASLLNVALLLSGISATRSQRILQVLNVVNKLINDTSFFIFFFTIFHLIAINFITVSSQNHVDTDIIMIHNEI